MPERIQMSRVVRYVEGEDEYLCTVIVENDTLYIVRTGNIGALPSAEGGDIVNQVEGIGTGEEYLEEVAENEADLQAVSPEELVRTPGSARVPLDEVMTVAVISDEDEDEPRLLITTTQGAIQLHFPQARGEDVRALQAALEMGRARD